MNFGSNIKSKEANKRVSLFTNLTFFTTSSEIYRRFITFAV